MSFVSGISWTKSVTLRKVAILTIAMIVVGVLTSETECKSLNTDNIAGSIPKNKNCKTGEAYSEKLKKCIPKYNQDTEIIGRK